MKTIAVLALAASAAPLLAHHSVAAEYDTSRTIAVRGTVTSVEWLNPHAHFLVQTQSDDGTVSTWKLELSSPAALAKQNIHRDFLKQGDRVALEVWRAKEGSLLAHVLTLTLPDGRAFSFPRQWEPGMPAVTPIAR